MTSLDFYFDPISPYAALAFEQLPQTLAGRSVAVRYLPIFLGAVLKAHDNKGPAEVPNKRDWVYRQVLWQSHRLQIPLTLPATHPFNPLALLRLLWATAEPGRTPSRYAVETVLRHVWQGGEDATDPERLQRLTQALAPVQDPAGDAVKAALREATDAAVARGVFGVPTIGVGDRLFWGLDALEMVRACVDGDPWFDGPDWHRAQSLPSALPRRAP